MTLRKLQPRVTIRNRDNSDGRYPTLNRTGDRTRTGKFSVAFDDTDTVIHRSGSSDRVLVSYPTSLRSGSAKLSSDLQSSITALGGVTRGVVDPWSTATKQVGRFEPFKEVGLHEQDKDKASAYFLTGSDPGDIGQGMSGRLDSKTAIRFELPLVAETHLDPLTASVYYYNVGGFFEEIASGSKQSGFGGRREAQLGTDTNIDRPMGVNYKMFDALGNYVISGTSIANRMFDRTTPFFFTNMGLNGPLVMSYREEESVLINPQYAANLSQSLDASEFLSDGFVIERVEIEMPFKAGPGWFSDFTRVTHRDRYDGEANDWLSSEIGGPCVTFAISNQITPNRRELILSSTLFPETDSTVRTYIEAADYGFWGLPLSGAIGGYTGQAYNYRFTGGYKAFRVKPTVIVPSQNNIINQFTGSVRFTAEPRIANGVVLGYSQPIYKDVVVEPRAPTTPVAYQTAVQGFLHAITPYGRGGDSNGSGRSIFGREFASPPRTMTPYQQELGLTYSTVTGLDSPIVYDYVVFNAQSNAYSPYVIKPNDRLVFSISKHRPTFHGQHAAHTIDYMPLTGSHDVSIPPGVLRVTLYGSHLRGGREFHDTNNAPLTSDNVHETINLEPVLDQFRGATRLQHSGTYLDNIITGSLTPKFVNGNLIGRGVIGSRATLSSTLYTDVRQSINVRETYSYAGTSLTFVQLSSPNERYWDTLLPAISDIFQTDGGTFYSVEGGTYGKRGFAQGILDSVPSIAGLDIPDNHITKEFPFGPRYSTLIRRLEQDKPRLHKVYDVSVGGIVPRTPDQLVGNAYLMYPTFATSLNYGSRGRYSLTDWNITELTGTFGGGFTHPLVRPPQTSDVVKLIFGFGDLNTVTVNSNQTSSYGSALGTTNFPELRTLDSAVVTGEQDNSGPTKFAPRIRGWKYGIMNGLPQYSKAVFRRDHYGQFRDMLEQRVFGTFYETVGYKSDGTLGGTVGKVQGPVAIRFVAKDGTTTDPDKTESCNQSNEATSSLPFFDGELRNRLDVDSTKIGTTLVAPFVL